MKSHLDCIPCFFSQALRAARIATDDERTIKEILDRVGAKLKDISLESTPPQTALHIYGVVNEMTGNNDPYRDLKHQSTQAALKLYPDLVKRVEASDDPLLTAIRLAIAGNIIDFAIFQQVDLESTIEKTLTQDFAVFDYDEFKRSLKKTHSVLYIGDNAGESVFDRILIEQLGKPVTYAVRGAPAINDVTYDDAIEAGLDRVATIVDSGTPAPGCTLEHCTPEFVRMFDEAEMIIAKGQGNFEALSDVSREVYYLFLAKCQMVARELGVERGSLIFSRSSSKA